MIDPGLTWMIYVVSWVLFVLWSWRRSEREYDRGYRCALDHIDDELRQGNGYEAREIVTKLRRESLSRSSRDGSEGGGSQ